MMAGFEDWFNNPISQIGLGLLMNTRAESPLAGAMNQLSAFQAAKAKRAYEQAQIERYGAQSEFERQQAEASRAQVRHQADIDARQQAIMEALARKLGINMGGQAQPQTPPPPQPSAPTAPPPGVNPFNGMPTTHDVVGGIPPQLLDNLMQVESGGNPKAVNPVTKAMGAYQFLPATVDMLRKQGVTFDPFNATQARTVAERYLQQLVQQNGGDVRKALAAYGGFKSKDPTAYVNKVMAGVSQGQSQTPQLPQADMNPDDIAQLGLLTSLGGLKGGDALMKYAEMSQPKNVPVNSYQRTPNGAMTFIPDPNQPLKNQQEERRITAEEARTAAAVEEKNQKMLTQKASNKAEYNAITSNFDRMDATIDKLINHPGLSQNTGLSGASGLYNLTEKGRDASVLLNSLKNKLVVDTLRDLKASSANGSSGFGPLSEPENLRLEGYVENLSRAQSLKQMQDALQGLKNYSVEAKARYAEKYKTLQGGGESPKPTGNKVMRFDSKGNLIP